jgi:hypothetical protein
MMVPLLEGVQLIATDGRFLVDVATEEQRVEPDATAAEPKVERIERAPAHRCKRRA